jgi:hypothetical protein
VIYLVVCFPIRGNDALNKSVTADESKVKSDIHCLHYDQLKLERQKAKLEIASYEEILKIIQDQISAAPSTHKTTSNTWKKEVDTSHPSIDSTVISSEWTQVSSKNHRKGVINSDKGATKLSEQLNKTQTLTPN